MSEVMEVMATDPTTTNDAIELTTYLKRKLASKFKEIEKDINKIADVIKGQDQIKRALRNDLCKECRDKSHEIFKLPLKSFSDVESQTMKSFLEADPSNNDKHYMKEDSTVISETEQKGEPLDSEKNTLQEDNAKMKQKLEEMKKKLEQSKETIDQLQEENGRLNDHRLTSKKDLRVVQDERDSYQTQLRSMQGEIDSLRKPVDGSLVRGITQDTTKTTSEQAKIVGKYSAFEQNVEKRLTENLASSNATGEQEFEQLILDVGKNQEQIRMSQPETEQFNSERNTLREENALMIQKHREMEMKLTQSHEDMGQLKEENRRLDADRDLRNSVIRSLKGEKEKQILYIKQLQQEKQRQDENVDGLQAKLEDLESKLKKIQEENLVSEQRDRDDALKSMKMEKENTESQMKRVQDEMTKLQKDLDQLNTKMAETESELTKTQKENEHLRDCQSARADEMRSLRVEIDQIHSQMERVQKEKQQIQLKVDQQTEKMKQTDSELIKAQNENRKLTGTHDIPQEIMDRQWRSEPIFDGGYLQSLKEDLEHYWPLQDMGVSQDALRHVNILFIGPIGAGKSSFINSVDSSFRGHVTMAAAAGNRDKSVTSAFQMFPITSSDNRQSLRFQLCDCRGLQDGIDITQDIDSILEGHIPNNYVINTNNILKASMHGYKQQPRLEDKIHCVVYVLDADKHSNHADIHSPFITDDVRKQVQTIQETVDRKGIPQLILLTKVDIVCEATRKSTSNIYRSSIIRQRCIAAAECLGLPPITVMPMRNYFSEVSTTEDISTLALFNVRQMLRAADTFLRVNHLDTLRSDKYETQYN